MLAKRRGFYKASREIIRTPLLLPSFSSKGFPEIQKIMEATQEVIDGEALVSAYDIHYKHLEGSLDFAQAIFLDSGGYESSKDFELSELGYIDHEPAAWSMDQYLDVVNNWSSQQPTVIVSYDHPKERISTTDQIERAEQSIPRGDDIFREILFKPENETDSETNIKAIEENIHKLAAFDAVGVTEKEIGSSLHGRMLNIARIRKALNNSGLGDKPIHVFGSLDTISTPLYFVSGADIFDGLTWLRFAYYNGMTIYRQQYAALNIGTQVKTDLVDARCFFANYQYMKEMQLEMKAFLLNKTFDSFGYHQELIERSYHAVMEETEENHGR